jgi:ABC transport system ATP-binding/permease protein
MFVLESTDDLGRKIVFPLSKVRSTIGRDSDADIVLADADVSREHAKIYLMENRVEIRDMDSSNGTYVNNQRIEGMLELGIGDEIIVGSNQFHLQKDACEDEAVDMTALNEPDVLRDEIPSRPGENEDETGMMFPDDLGDVTQISTPAEMIAAIYNKKTALARYPSLEILFGQLKGSKYLLPPGDYLIGRGVDCNIRMDDEKVSARHAIIRVSPGDVIFEDLDSTNGSIINNRKATQTVLSHKDVIVIGEAKLKFVNLQGATAKPKTEAPDAFENELAAVTVDSLKKRSIAPYLAGAVAILMAIFLFLLYRS